MNLQEQINRTKTLMRLQSLNEGSNQYQGTISNIISKSEDTIPDEFKSKYGDINEMGVQINSFTTMTSEASNQTRNITTLDIIKAKTNPVKTLSDDNVKFYAETYVVSYTSNNNTVTYLKVLYYSKQLTTIKQKIENIKNCIKSLGRPNSCVGNTYEVSDVKSSLSENNKLVCTSDSLDGKSNVCELPQNIIDMIMNEYKEHEDFNTIKSLLKQ
jgi:hypothetical protein